MAVNVLEYALRLAISRRLSPVPREAVDALLEEYMPPYSFDAKIQMGYALNIFSKDTKKTLSTIKHIRNTFAHAPARVSFSTPAVCDACLSIKPHRDLAKLAGKGRTVRAQFLRTVQWLSILIIRKRPVNRALRM